MSTVPSMNAIRCVSLVICLITPASALPGQSTTPEAAGVPSLLMRADERSKLVYINNAQISNVEVFTSKSGNQHLRFNLKADNTTYSGIFFDGDWKKSDQALLSKGKASLLGIWGSFDGKPSFTAMYVAGSPIKPDPKVSNTPKLLFIRDAKVNPATVDQFKSSNNKLHITFTFQANGKSYQGIVFEGIKDESTAKLLRSGRVTLYGTWSEYKNKPSFVVERVEK